MSLSASPLFYDFDVKEFGFHVREVSGEEHVSKPWKMTLKFVLDYQTMRGNPDLFDPDYVIKEVGTLLLKRDIVERRLTGVVTSAKLSCATSGVPEVTIVLEPRYALLRWRKDVRIHRNLSVPEIVTEVAGALGVKVEWRLNGSYQSRPYCVQWRETDFDYCNRLMEDEGIFYFFNEDDVMILGDNPGSYDVIKGEPSLPFRKLAGADEHRDCINRLGSRAALTAGKVTLRDWNTEHPSLDMDVSSRTAVTQGPEWYDYPGEYEQPAEGQRKAVLHAEAFDRKAAAVTGESTAARLYPGATFAMLDAPLTSMDGGYVIRSISHRWHRTKGGFTVSFEADRDNISYRPSRQTYVPRILNPHTAIVTVSSPGEDIHCDHFGRVKVHFHWDRLRPFDDDASHWVPVLQDNTGHSSAIPREGWEVGVHYMEGDPDRPLVMGRVFNPKDRFSDKLPDMKTRTSIKSETTPTREGSNEIRFDDVGGYEQIYMHAEKDQNIEIANNQDIDVGTNDNSTVKNNETIDIGSNADWDIGGDCQLEVENDQSWSVGGNRTLKISCGDGKTVVGDLDVTIGGNHEVEAGHSCAATANKLEEEIGGNLTETCESTHQTEIGGTYKLKIGGSLNEEAKLSKMDQATEEFNETIKAKQVISCGGEYQMRCDEERKTVVSGRVLAKSLKGLTLTGAELFRTLSPKAIFNGDSDIVLKVGETVVTMKSGLVKIKAPNTISLLISGKNNQGASKSQQN